MQRKQSSTVIVILTIVIEMLIAFSTILGNFASDALKNVVKPYLPYSFYLFVFVTLFGISLTFLRHRLQTNRELLASTDKRHDETTLSHSSSQDVREVIGGLASPYQHSRLGIVQLALVTIVLPLVAILTFNSAVIQHPWLTAYLCALYEVIIFIVIIVGKQISNWIDIQLRGILFGYQRRYYQFLIYQHRDFDVKGLSTQGIYTLELEQVFVDLSIDPKPAHQTSSNPFQVPDQLRTGRHSIWDYLASKQLTNQHFVIIGAPGSGKTTLLKHMTLTLISRKWRHLPFRIQAKLPVLLFLRDHIDALIENPDLSLMDAVRDHFKKWNQPAPLDWLDQQLALGHCLILLDGLDEIADLDARQKMVDWVQRQMVTHGQNRFIVTSRPFGYRSNPLSGVTVLEVRSFNFEQIEQFIKNWYFANEIKNQGRIDSDVRTVARAGSQDLLRRLQNTPALFALAINPLLLTMIATIHLYRGALPDKRVELYAEICEVFLGKRQEARGLVLELTAAQKQQVLQPLAYQMMQKGIQQISLAEACQLIADPLTRVSSHIHSKSFLQLVENASGLLLEREHEVYSFAHLTFQEYLAAVYIKEQGFEHQLIANVGIDWWNETVRLYCAQTDATSLISACLTSEYPSSSALTLAIECQQEALNIHPSVKEKLDNLLDRGIEDADLERRQIVAEALLARHLRQMVNIGENIYADTSLITCAEYQLFLDEYRAQDVYYQPDHWTDSHFPPGQGRTPVLGVRPSDATAFCAWLTERETGDWLYRLPMANELEKVVKVYCVDDKFSEDIGSWVDDGKGFAWIKMNQVQPDCTVLKSFTLDHSRVLDLAYDLDSARELALELEQAIENALNAAHSPESSDAIDYTFNSSSNRDSSGEDDIQLEVAPLKSLEQSTRLYFDKDRNDDARNRALNYARVRALNRTRAGATSSRRARVLLNSRVHALKVVTDLESAIINTTHEPNRDSDNASNKDSARSLIRVRARESINTLERVQASIHGIHHTLAFARARTRSPLRAHSHARLPKQFVEYILNRISTCIHDFQAIRALDLDFNNDLCGTPTIDNALVDVLKRTIKLASKRQINIMHNKREVATFLRWFICFFAEVLAIHLLYQTWSELSSQTWLERSFHLNKDRQPRDETLESAAIGYLNIFASFALLEERVHGKFPACEAILIREGTQGETVESNVIFP